MYFRTLIVAVMPALVCNGPGIAADTPENIQIADGPFKSNWESLKQYRCPEWFRDAKFGIWAHWGPQAVPRCGDWYARKMYEENSKDYKHHVATYGHPSKFGYKDILPLWKAEKWEPDKLMVLYKKAGARYFVSQAVHCDNFDLWDSKFHKWNAVKMGPGRDVVGTWKKAAAGQGLRFGVSEHVGYSRCWFQTSHGADKTGPLAGVPYDGADPKYKDLYHPVSSQNGCAYSKDADWHREWLARMKDLADQYQPDLFYTDGGVPFGEVGLSLVAHLYNSSLKNHNGKPEVVYTCKDMHYTGGEYVNGTCVQDVERGMLPEISPLPWQTDTSNGDWYFDENDKYRGAGTILPQLVDIVSKNGNLLLNVIQYPDGSLPQESAQLLDDLAAWFAVNGEAIHATRPWGIFGEGPTKVAGGHFKESFAYTSKDIRFTRSKDGKVLYALALGWPADGKLLIGALAAAGGKVDSVEMLGSKAQLEWRQVESGLEITMPANKPCEHVFAFKIQGPVLKAATE